MKNEICNIQPRKPFNPDQNLVTIGSRLINRTVKERDWDQLRTYINDANSSNETTRNNGAAVLLGIGMRGAQLLDQIHAAGMITFTGDTRPSAEGIAYAFKTDQNNFIRQVNNVTGTLAKVMKALPGLTLQQVQPVAARQDSLESEPLKIEITAMPDRRTTTDISRDGNGVIVSSAQIETDL